MVVGVSAVYLVKRHEYPAPPPPDDLHGGELLLAGPRPTPTPQEVALREGQHTNTALTRNITTKT